MEDHGMRNWWNIPGIPEYRGSSCTSKSISLQFPSMSVPKRLTRTEEFSSLRRPITDPIELPHQQQRYSSVESEIQKSSIHDRSSYISLTRECCSATEALERMCQFDKARKAGKLPTEDFRTGMIEAGSLKRKCRSSLECYDISGWLRATQSVEDSMLFPVVEWDSSDDLENQATPKSRGDQPATDARLDALPGTALGDDTRQPSAKRRCRGLLRSKRIHEFDFVELKSPT